MTNKIKYIFSAFLLSYSLNAQTESLSNSPYSLYGLGILSDITTGKTNALGRTGIAIPSDQSINNLNPASLSSIKENSFLYDIGFKTQIDELQENGSITYKTSANFSNIAFAFPVVENMGMAITLAPYSNVGYTIDDVQTNVEGYDATFETDFEGSGGLNDLKWSAGYAPKSWLSVGLSGSLLFGNITQLETSTISVTSLSITEKSTYVGFRLTGGLQLEISKWLRVGGTISLPTSLSAHQTYTVSQLYEDDIESDRAIDNFKLPLEIGLGTQLQLDNRFSVTMDYKKSFWTATRQSDQTGDFVDQQYFGVGLEYSPKQSLNYVSRVQYRLGYNYDDGHIQLSDQRITTGTMSAGLGLPINKKFTNSFLNVSYSYGQKGRFTNGLIKDNYHLLTLNVSLEGLWFRKKSIL